MVKPLTFKGDKKVKKRKRPADAELSEGRPAGAVSTAAGADVEEALAEDDSWVSAEAVTDVAGPVLFVLPSLPPTALACDAAGTVFASAIENIVDGNPSSAEPHDVRQVWVANKIVGTERQFRFKGHHGKYLACDKYGILSATSEAVSPLESFVLVPSDPDATAEKFRLLTLRDTYIAVKEPSATKAKTGDTQPDIRGDVEGELDADTTETTLLRIRMQARFKPRLKASKEEKAWEKISRRELQAAVGRPLDDKEVRALKRARKDGNYHETLLDIKVKSKHDKYG